jgi:hypothetical protein
MVIGTHIKRGTSRKATSSSRKVNHSGSKTNTAGRCVIYREVLGATAIGNHKMASDAELTARLQGAWSLLSFWPLYLCLLLYRDDCL